MKQELLILLPGIKGNSLSRLTCQRWYAGKLVTSLKTLRLFKIHVFQNKKHTDQIFVWKYTINTPRWIA